MFSISSGLGPAGNSGTADDLVSDGLSLNHAPDKTGAVDPGHGGTVTAAFPGVRRSRPPKQFCVAVFGAEGWVALAVTRQGSHGPGRACINASGSSADRLALPGRVPATIRARFVDRVRSLDVLHLFPSLGSAGRRFASLPRVLRGEFPCFNGSTKALRLPAARPAALRCLRLAVPQRPLVRFAPRRTSAPSRPGVGNPVSPAGISTEETTGSFKELHLTHLLHAR
jgi:hypothetical protein